MYCLHENCTKNCIRVQLNLKLQTNPIPLEFNQATPNAYQLIALCNELRPTLTKSPLKQIAGSTRVSPPSIISILSTDYLRICSCLACVYRVMDACGKFGEHDWCVRVLECSSNFPSASITRYTHSWKHKQILLWSREKLVWMKILSVKLRKKICIFIR